MNKSTYLEKSKTYKGYHYSVLTSDMLQYLHKRTLEMFLEVKKIFEENQIKYMICGGTLLGALGGGCGHFIPWDDDFDICIFEDDYEKAIDCLTDKKNGLPEGMILQCTKTDPKYYLGWMKIRDKYSHTYPDAPSFKENGVWIDLYKLVKCKSRDVPILIAQEAIDYLNRRLLAGGLTEEQYDQRIKEGQLYEKLAEARKLSSNKNVENDKQVFIIWSASKVVLESEWIDTIRVVDFEGVKVTTFGGAEKYLTQHYGSNYKILPPDEMRRVGLTRIEY